jgi:predicted ATPase/DNA-binding winged helix-turn-helix (wHTH) protein
MIEIGRFEIDLQMRTLRQNGEVVPLGSRAFDILATVASAGGRLVTKDELMNAVWPETVVEENNIQVHLSALRKILGPDRDLILTVPGRGYQLLQRKKEAAPLKPPAPHAQPVATGRLPRPKTHLVGRDVEVAQIRATLKNVHVLTLVGAGGIGKTSLAIEVARQVAQDCPVPLCFVELAALNGKDEIVRAIIEASGLAGDADNADAACLAAALSGTNRLLLLDNAEHVIGHVAEIVEQLVAENDALRVLVTSREPLRIMPEAVFKVDPLDVPPPHATDAEILARSAVNLFVMRAHSMQGKAGPDNTEIQLVGEICRRLDGIPLAIELAAARVLTLGVEGVHRRLDDRMAILAGGYRTALPRHQTLRATFDWSFALLDTSTRALFRRLATFGGVFTFEAMCAVVCDAELMIGNAIHGIGELVSKSLVNVEFDGPVAKYRLAECTRAYALEKLHAEGEARRIATLHTRYLSTCLEAQSTAPRQHLSGNTSDLQQTFDDARSASDWAFSSDGDRQLGVELASNLVGALLDRGLMDECCVLATRAVDAMDTLPPATVGVATEMRVRAALASALTHVRGPVWKSLDVWRDVLDLAIQADDAEFHARALWGLWNAMLSSGRINESMQFATQFQHWAQTHGTTWQKILADQLAGVSLHCLGRHADARERLMNVLQRFASLREDEKPTGRFAVDPLVFCNGTLARIVLLQGDPEKAMMIVDKTVDLVGSQTMEPSLTHVLGTVAVPLALMCGDLHLGCHYLEIMRSQAALHRFDIWNDCCECLTGCRDILDGQVETGLSRLDGGLDALLARGFRRLITPFIVASAEALVAMGRLTQASARLREALDFCQANGELFFLPEVWRGLGVVAHAEARAHATQLSRNDPACRDKIDEASACFTEAIELARTQGARWWELRASLAMGRLLHEQRRYREALEALDAIATCFERECAASDVHALFELLDAVRACASGEIQRMGVMRAVA